jgi:hypothetical protein
MYNTPNPEELRDFLRRHEFTGADAARLVGVGPRTVRHWTAPPTQSNARSIPWAAWTLLRLYTGEMTLEEYRQAIAAEEITGLEDNS